MLEAKHPGRLPKERVNPLCSTGRTYLWLEVVKLTDHDSFGSAPREPIRERDRADDYESTAHPQHGSV